MLCHKGLNANLTGLQSSFRTMRHLVLGHHCKRLGNALFSHTGCVCAVFSQGGLPYGAGSKQSGFGPSEKGHLRAGPRDGGKAQRKCRISHPAVFPPLQ